MRLYDIQNEIEMARDREREVKIKRILEKRESCWLLCQYVSTSLVLLVKESVKFWAHPSGFSDNI